MTDPTDPRAAPGMDSLMQGYATAAKSLQTFASEMQNLSKEAMDKSAAMMEQLRGARTVEEAVSIQTAFMQQSFASYADYTRKFSELMMAVPMELAKQGQAAFQQGTARMTKATEEVGEQVKKAGEHFNQHNG